MQEFFSVEKDLIKYLEVNMMLNIENLKMKVKTKAHDNK